MRPKFQIGQRVFHNLPDGPMGIVIDWRYTASLAGYEYQVAFVAGEQSLWYYPSELSEEKILV